jgi:hypothetical protein
MSGGPIRLFPSQEVRQKGGVCRLMAKNTPLNPLSRGDFENYHDRGFAFDSDDNLNMAPKSFCWIIS